jgi:hypothetical protein
LIHVVHKRFPLTSGGAMALLIYPLAQASPVGKADGGTEPKDFGRHPKAAIAGL